MIGVESWSPSSVGVATAGISGSFAYFWYSAWVDRRSRTIHAWGTPL